MNEAKCVVVTGASSGIGAAVADMLGASGYKVVVTSRDEKKLHELYDGNDRAIIIPWDLSDADNVGEYAKQVKERVGSISGLVHCAGIDKRMPIHMIKAVKI
jgi:short-subunit dehydrogenase